MVYEKNIGLDGKLKFYVAKGYSLKLFFQLCKTFSIVVILKSIKLLLSIIVCLIYEI